VVIGYFNYINHARGVFGVFSFFRVNHFILRIPHFTLDNSCALGWSMEMNGWRRRAIMIWL
jgi:hypothetical protein